MPVSFDSFIMRAARRIRGVDVGVGTKPNGEGSGRFCFGKSIRTGWEYRPADVAGESGIRHRRDGLSNADVILGSQRRAAGCSSRYSRDGLHIVDPSLMQRCTQGCRQ